MISVILALIAEYIIFAYYLNSEAELKASRAFVNAVTAMLYGVYTLICIFSPIPLLNVLLFFLINVTLLHISLKRSMLFNVFIGMLLTAFMMFSELLVGVVFNIGVGDVHSLMTKEELYILTAFSKLIYFICVAILRRYTTSKRDVASLKEELLFLMLPVATCVFFNAFAKIRLQVDQSGHSALILVSVLLIVANVLIYLVYNMISDKNERIQSLTEDRYRREIEHKSYELLRERYDDLRGMVHDFERYCNNIEGLMGESTAAAMEEIRHIRSKNKALLLVERTNNKALNVILDQKLRECGAKGIDFKINIQKVDLSFINELDTVTVFANLIDNAIEGCENAVKGCIELEISTLNEAYTVIRVINSCGEEPMMADGIFKTVKKNKAKHGIGLKSVQRALDIYKAKMKCEFEKETKTFSVTILINDKVK